MIVDAWIQHPTPEFLAQPMFAQLLRWMRVDEIPTEIPLEVTLGALDAAGVDLALVSAWWGPRGPILTNDDVHQLCLAAPQRLRGVASVDLHRPMVALAELERCVRELGFVALRLLPWLWGLPPDDRRYYPLYAKCVELGIPFCTQVGHAGPLCPSEPGRPIPYLDHVACDFPELVIVGGHVGYPWTDEMIALATKHRNVYIDTSAWRPSRLPESLVRYLRGNGRKKVLYGSNYPMLQPHTCLGDLDTLDLDEETRELFLSENARRVFALDPTGSGTPAEPPTQA